LQFVWQAVLLVSGDEEQQSVDGDGGLGVGSFRGREGRKVRDG